MRLPALSLLLITTVPAQTQLVSLVGTARTITRNEIVVQTGAGATLLYADNETKVWRGQSGNVLTVVRPGDEVLVRYRQDSNRLVIVGLYANITHVWGRITVVTKDGFEVNQNFNADPQSGYRRGKRQITLSSGTKFEESARQDLRAGRMVDIIGLETTDPGVQATRVIVYEGNAPVRMPAGARVIAPDGSVRF
jgi:Domain of unknown function (DUF5666)